MIAFAGLPVQRFLRTTDSMERQLWIAVAERVIMMKQQMDDNRAKLIANAVGKMLGAK